MFYKSRSASLINQTVDVISSIKADETFEFKQKGLRRKMFEALSRQGSIVNNLRSCPASTLRHCLDACNSILRSLMKSL